MNHIMTRPVLNEKSDEFRDVEKIKKVIADHLDDAMINLVMCHGNAAAIQRNGNIVTVTIEQYRFNVMPIYTGTTE